MALKIAHDAKPPEPDDSEFNGAKAGEVPGWRVM
jgi:hypothetical protein